MGKIEKAHDFLDQAESYVDYIVGIVTDPTEQLSKKQVTFLDNQDKIQECITGLDGISTKLKNMSPQDEEENNEIDELIDRASDLKDKIILASESLKKQLSNIDPNITPEDMQVKVTEETITNAMQNNKTTQEINKNMTQIAEDNKKAVKAKAPKAKYALVVDGRTTYINAVDKDELNKKIQSVLNGYTGPDVSLYQVSYTQMPLKTKTTYCV